MESEIKTKICDSTSIIVVIIHTKFQLHWMFETEVRWLGHLCPLLLTLNRGTPPLIWLRSDDNKTMQSIDMIETYAYAMNKYLVCKKKELNVTI